MKTLLLILLSFNLTAQTSVSTPNTSQVNAPNLATPTLAERVKLDPSAAHIWGSIIMTSVFSDVHFKYTSKQSMIKSVMFGATCSLIIGVVCKEIIHDKLLGRGVYNNWDIADDCWGTLVGCLFITAKLDFNENGFVKWKDYKVNPYKSGKRYYFK